MSSTSPIPSLKFWWVDRSAGQQEVTGSSFLPFAKKKITISFVNGMEWTPLFKDWCWCVCWWCWLSCERLKKCEIGLLEF
jgi:hypothetical protein